MSDQNTTPAAADLPEELQPAHVQPLATNDAVAGETVLEGAGDGNDGPTGGSPREAEPMLPENELGADQVDLEERDPRSSDGGA